MTTPHYDLIIIGTGAGDQRGQAIHPGVGYFVGFCAGPVISRTSYI
jgi:hypothetical protein